MHVDVLLIIVQLIFLEGILSLDNAAALGAMVTRLPADASIPWPRALHGLGRLLDPILGKQRGAALKVGLLGAYVGRGLMLLVATIIIQNQWLRLIGGLYLLYLALNYLGELGHRLDNADAPQPLPETPPNFWLVVLMVELADLAFSLDNVVAAVALSDQYWVVLIGVGIGILFMRFAATLFTRMISWEPRLETTAYLLIGAISIELLLDDLFHIHFGTLVVGPLHINAEAQQFGVTLMIIGITLAFARVRWLQPLNVIWRPLLVVCRVLLYPFQWLLWPVRALAGLVGSLVRARQARP